VPQERTDAEPAKANGGVRGGKREGSTTAGYQEAASEPSLGANLEPALRETCQGRLSCVRWFRTDWQRGGALTGYATYQDDGGNAQPVVVKLPVGPGERLWLERLQVAGDVVPKLYAHGRSLGGYDLAWVVMERLPYGPLNLAWQGKEFDLLIEAVGRFYVAAQYFPVTQSPPSKDWLAIFDLTRQNVQRHGIANEQRWNRVLKKTHRKLKGWLVIWDDRPQDQWCHGDLHLANAMTREDAPGGSALLFDFAQTHPGHWVQDAVYLEHLYWARRSKLCGRKVCKQIAHERKKRGLVIDRHWSRWATVGRALVAMSTPAMLRHDGDPRHVQAALEVLESHADK